MDSFDKGWFVPKPTQDMKTRWRRCLQRANLQPVENILRVEVKLKPYKLKNVVQNKKEIENHT